MSLDPNKVKKTQKKNLDIITVTETELAPFFNRTSGHQNVYKCPFCKARGHKGGGYKLFYNPSKKQGYCHVCQLIVVAEESYDIGTELDTFIKTFKEKETTEEWYDVISWTKPASESPEIRQYVDTRQLKYTNPVLDRYGIRYGEIVMPDFSILPLMIFPNSMKEVDGELVTNFFQYKCLDPKVSLPKYVTICSAPLVWLGMCLVKKEIIIVEGLFDAIAVGGCAMTGKTLSKKQQQQLREFCLLHPEIESVTVAPDNDLTTKEVKRLLKIVKPLIGDIPLYKATIPSDMKDPENVVASGKYNEVFVNELQVIG